PADRREQARPEPGSARTTRRRRRYRTSGLTALSAYGVSTKPAGPKGLALRTGCGKWVREPFFDSVSRKRAPGPIFLGQKRLAAHALDRNTLRCQHPLLQP